MKMFLSHKRDQIKRKLLESALHELESGVAAEDILPENIYWSLTEQYETNHYRKKLQIYKRERRQTVERLTSIQNDFDGGVYSIITIEGLGYPVHHISDEELLATVQKVNELSRLIVLYEKYLATGLDIYKYSIDSIELSASVMNRSAFHEFLQTVSVSETHGDLQRSFFAKQLRKMMGRKIVPVLLDLRTLFRSIIRFHFKNMDDESGDPLNANIVTSIHGISPNNSYINGRRRNSISIKRAA